MVMRALRRRRPGFRQLPLRVRHGWHRGPRKSRREQQPVIRRPRSDFSRDPPYAVLVGATDTALRSSFMYLFETAVINSAGSAPSPSAMR